MPPGQLWELYDAHDDQVVTVGSLWDCQIAALELKAAEDYHDGPQHRVVVRPARSVLLRPARQHLGDRKQPRRPA